MVFHRNKGKSKYSGIIVIVQKIGIIHANTIDNFVMKDTLESSSQLSFLNVVKCQAKEAKLNIEIMGVTRGKTNIIKRYNAFIP